MRLLGGINRDVAGPHDAPPQFHLTVDRELRSGKLDEIELTERQIIRLIADGAQALDAFARQRDEEASR
jgi:hypothetical protein